MATKKQQKSERDLAPLDLVEISNSIEDATVKITVAFTVGDVVKQVTTTYETLYSDLSRCGYSMCRADERKVKDMITSQIVEETAVTFTYKGLGWFIYNNMLIFKGNTLYPDELNGRYEGTFDIEPHGDMTKLSQAIQNLLIGHLPLEFAFISGLSASTVGLLKRLGADVNTIVLNIYGDSSTGKTSCAKLAVSVGCNTASSGEKDSLAMDCNTTTNALAATLNNNYGYPVLFDELGELDDRVNLRSILYSVSNGKDKSRCDPSGEVLKRRDWGTVVLFTGEHSVLDLTPNTDGILVRVLNLPEVRWTESAEQSRKINRFSRKYSGLPLEIFSRHLYAQDHKQLMQRFDSYTEELSSKIILEGGYNDRFAKVAAIYKITAEYASEVFGVTFDTNGITDFVIEHINQTQEKIERTDLYDRFMQYVTENSHLFHSERPNDCCLTTTIKGNDEFTSHNVSHPSGKVLGYIEYGFCSEDNKRAKYVVILKDAFRRFFEQYHGKGDGINKTLKEWYKKDLLLPTKEGRYVTTIPKTDPYVSMLQVNDSGTGVSCYKIRCNFPEDEVLSEDNPVSPRKTLRQLLEEPEPKTAAEMLSDDDIPLSSTTHERGDEDCKGNDQT